jgi:hypothetical protein
MHLELCREYAQTVATHVGMLTMSQLGAAERRKEWNREVAEVRSKCQVRSQQHAPLSQQLLSTAVFWQQPVDLMRQPPPGSRPTPWHTGVRVLQNNEAGKHDDLLTLEILP